MDDFDEEMFAAFCGGWFSFQDYSPWRVDLLDWLC